MTIISISDYLSQKGDSVDNMSLEQMLMRASLMVREAKGDGEGLLQMNKHEFRKFFEMRFNKILMQEKKISSGFFLCAMYISQTLMDIIPGLKGTFYATDYMEKWIETGKSEHLKNGADTCFVLCTFFPERCERRNMKKGDYIAIGSGLYYHYYNEEGGEIAYHMSNNFDVMSEIAARCL